MLTHQRQATINIARALPSTDELVSIIKQRVNGDVIDPFFIPAEISSDVLDTYHTHMDISTLRNFAAHAADGRAILDSHDGRKLSIGYSLTGQVEQVAADDKHPARSRVVSVGYTVPGISFGGNHSFQTTSDYIKAVESGIVRDVSVGLHGGRYVCDLCGGDYRRYSDCPHIAGRPYERDGAIEICTVGIFDARLSEWSLVFDGACPTAMILKAEDYAGSSDAERVTVRYLEESYRINLGSERRWSGVDIHGKAVDSADQQGSGNRAPEDEQMNAIDKHLKTLREGGAVNDWAVKAIEELRSENERLQPLEGQVTELEQRVSELEPLAKAGEAYRANTEDEAIKEGIRALGDDFDEEAQRTLLGKLDMDMVRQMGASWRAIGDAKFGSGGRQVNDEVDEDETNEREIRVPDSAYAG